MDDLSRFCCQNSQCPKHGKRGAGNLTVTSRYGRDKQRRMLRRAALHRSASPSGRERPLFDSSAAAWNGWNPVLEHIAEGCGVRRQTGRLCKVNRNTVGRLSRLAGDHARDLHGELVAAFPRT